MIHQTDSCGQFSWGGDIKKDPHDIMYNLKLAKEGSPRRNFAHEHTHNANGNIP